MNEVYESKMQPGLSFTVSKLQFRRHAPAVFIVVMQVEGYPATEACDDWFASESDAAEVAKKLAAGEAVEVA